jgi:hypothetical protein
LGKYIEGVFKDGALAIGRIASFIQGQKVQASFPGAGGMAGSSTAPRANTRVAPLKMTTKKGNSK